MLGGDDIKPGQSLGKYEIVRKLAVGGMAEIYLARTRGTAGFEKLVVLKRILPSITEDPGFVEMFLDEARLAATLRHPNIGDVFDVGDEDGSFYFAMEFVHGQDSRTIKQAAAEARRDIPIEIGVGIITGVTYALAYAHAKSGPQGPLGIVHRDVSPSNILVSYDGAVKLVDFGIARADNRNTSAKTRTGTLKGKVPYMSPEQCRGRTLDRRSDLFSLGTVLYELTTGRRPFQGHSEYDTLEMIVLGKTEPPSVQMPKYLPELEVIVMRLLERDPAKRYQNADDVLIDLERLTKDSGLLVSERVVARYMRELFAEEIAEWEAHQANPTLRDDEPSNNKRPGSERTSDRGSNERATHQPNVVQRAASEHPAPNTVELSLDLDLEPPTLNEERRSTREYPDGTPQLINDKPTAPISIEQAADLAMQPLLITPDVQVFLRPSTKMAAVADPTTRRAPTAPPTDPAGTPPGSNIPVNPRHAAARLSSPTRPPPLTTPPPPQPLAPRPAPITSTHLTVHRTATGTRTDALPRHSTEEHRTPDDLAIAHEGPGVVVLTSRPSEMLSITTRPTRELEPSRQDNLFDPVLGRGKDILAEVDANAPKAENPTDRARRRVNALITRCSRWLATGELDQAMVAAELALEEDTTDEAVVLALVRGQPILLTAYEAFLGDRTRPLILGRPIGELAKLELDQRAAFLLSCIDGKLSIENVIQTSRIPRFEASRSLCRLIIRKIIITG